MVLLKQTIKGTKNNRQGTISLYQESTLTQFGLANYVIRVMYYDTPLRYVWFMNKEDAEKYYDKLIHTGMNNVRWNINMDIRAEGDVVFFKKRYHTIGVGI